MRNPSNKCNGMTFDAGGNLYVCDLIAWSIERIGTLGNRVQMLEQRRRSRPLGTKMI